MKSFISSLVIVLISLVVSVSEGQTYACLQNKLDYQSDFTKELSDSVREIYNSGFDNNSNVFMIVGDSNSGNGGALSYYMGNCSYPYGSSASVYGWINIKDLDCYPEYKDSLDFFLAGTMTNGVTSFTRDSIAAYPGRTASWALTGNPSPLQQEITAINPQYALIMFGTNDTYDVDPEETWLLDEIIDEIMAVADYCAERGIIPIVKAPPIKTGYEEQMEYLSEKLRVESDLSQYPFIDMYAATLNLPAHGQGSDGIHFRYYGYNRMCAFHAASLDYGVNMHNLVTLQILDSLYRATELNEQCLDNCEPPPVDTDTGTSSDSVDTDTGTGSESIDTGHMECGCAGHDLDDDAICSASDNCPMTYNPGQEDLDSDGIGNLCDCN